LSSEALVSISFACELWRKYPQLEPARKKIGKTDFTPTMQHLEFVDP